MPGYNSSDPRYLTNMNGTLFFAGDDRVHSRELWKLAPLPGDTNYDGLVDITDLNNVRNNFGYTGDERPGDTTGDGVVGLDDLNAVRNHFGEGTPEVAQSVVRPWVVRMSDVRQFTATASAGLAISTAAVDLLFTTDVAFAPVATPALKLARRRAH